MKIKKMSKSVTSVVSGVYGSVYHEVCVKKKVRIKKTGQYT